MKCTRCRVIMSRLRTRSRDYCIESSLHGVRYITDPKSSKFKSYFWAFICTISTCLCFILIRSQFRSFYSNRITTTILTTAFPIWEVPFPAVTICNFNIVHKESIKPFKELLERQKISSDVADNFFSNLSSLVLSSKFEKDVHWEEFQEAIKLLEYAGYNTERLMAALAHPCDDMINNCYWNNKERNCSQIFQIVKTTSGFCCSFNYRGRAVDKDEFYVSGVGPSFGLYLHLRVSEDQYISSLKHSSGIDISVHENIQYPDMSIYSTTIRSGNDVSLAIKPEITQSENDVGNTDIHTRGCAFADEVTQKMPGPLAIKLGWTSNYSYTTCVNKCKAEAVQKLCRCIPFYHYPLGKGRFRYCTLTDLACITENNVKIKNSKITYSGIRMGHSHLQVSEDNLKCKCYPQCNEISYSYQPDQQPIRLLQSEESRANDSVLRVYFSHVSCTKLLRSVLITWELILASVGGLIGLCLGGSILSIIEFFYHVTETLFARYAPKKKPTLTETTNYEPKLYLTDFSDYSKKIIHVSSLKPHSDKKGKINLH